MEPLRFLIDTQLPPVLAAYLRRKGFDALHTTTFEQGHLLADADIRRIAQQQQRIVVTKDSDFSNHFHVAGAPPRVLYLTLGNCRNHELINWLDLHLGMICQLFSVGASMVVASRQQLVSY